MTTQTPMKRTLVTLVGFIVAAIMFFPIFWTVITSFKTELGAIRLPPELFFSPTLESYRQVFARADYWTHLLNTLIAALGSTALCLVLGVPAAYYLAFFPRKWTLFVLLWMVSTKFIPPVGVIVAIYVIFNSIGLLNHIFALVLVYTGMNLPIVIWLLFSSFREIPQAIFQAARVDGASTGQEIRHILIPLALPGMIAGALLAVILAWNEAFFALNLTTSSAAPLSVFIASFRAAEGFFWARMSAASTIAIVPIVVLGWFAQTRLVKGLTFGAVD